MDISTSKVLIETVVRKTIREIKESPERSTRNIVDMAMQFSKGRFQKQFFAMLQDKLQNEHSAYYGLVRDVVEHVDAEHLLTFGMNLGYHSCTAGAELIRDNEKKLGCNIPWTVSLQIDGDTFAEQKEHYHTVIGEGAHLGIYSWMLFAQSQPMELLPLIGSYPDCAFFLFCPPEDISVAFLDTASALHNLMVVVRCDGDADDACMRLRSAGLLYSVYYPYSEADLPAITNGDLFCGMEQLHPAFSALIARPGCPAETCRLVSEAVAAARMEQHIQTMLWEFDSDNRMVDEVISEDTCTARFDSRGMLCRSNEMSAEVPCSLFNSSLLYVFRQAFPKRG